VCSIPSAVLQWLAVVAATIVAAVGTLKNSWPAIHAQAAMPLARVLLLTLLGAYVGLGVVLKLFFFPSPKA
jgi:hypothetical protein